MIEQDALWSAQEVRTQAAQCRDQLTVWDMLDELATDSDGRADEPR